LSINVSYKKVEDANEAYKLVKEHITPETIAKYNVKADFTYDEGKQISAKGKGFELVLSFDNSMCNGKINLSFMFKPFKSKILTSIEKQLSRIL
jgi:hypothetical protein